MKLYSFKKTSGVAEGDSVWSQKTQVLSPWLKALYLEQDAADSGLQFPLSPLEGATYLARNTRGLDQWQRWDTEG